MIYDRLIFGLFGITIKTASIASVTRIVFQFYLKKGTLMSKQLPGRLDNCEKRLRDDSGKETPLLR